MLPSTLCTALEEKAVGLWIMAHYTGSRQEVCNMGCNIWELKLPASRFQNVVHTGPALSKKLPPWQINIRDLIFCITIPATQVVWSAPVFWWRTATYLNRTCMAASACMRTIATTPSQARSFAVDQVITSGLFLVRHWVRIPHMSIYIYTRVLCRLWNYPERDHKKSKSAANIPWQACMAASLAVGVGKQYSITILALPESVGFSLMSLSCVDTLNGLSRVWTSKICCWCRCSIHSRSSGWHANQESSMHTNRVLYGAALSALSSGIWTQVQEILGAVGHKLGLGA